MIAAAVIRSNLAVTGLIIALGTQGVIDFEGCAALVLGGQIIAASTYRIFNAAGVLVTLPLFYPIVALIEAIIPGFSGFTVKTAGQAAQYGTAIGTKPLAGPHIAMAYTFFTGIYICIYVWLIPVMEKRSRGNIPEKTRDIEFSPIDSKLVRAPVPGISEAKKRLILMAQKAVNSALYVQDIIASETGQKKLCDDVFKGEKVIDEYNKHLTGFLVRLTACPLSECDARNIVNYIALSHNIEKYADHLEDIALIFDEIDRNRLVLTEDGRKSLMEVFREAANFFNISFGAFEEHVDNVGFLEESRVVNRRIKALIREGKSKHFWRIRERVCHNEEAIYFMDLLNSMDGMRAQAYNIAEITTGAKYRWFDL
jgi:phosphate:Na+ symporter